MGIHRVAFQAAEIMLKYIIVASVVCAAVVCALDTEKPPMKPKPPMEPKDSASLIDDMLDEHASLNEDLDAKQRTEMHDFAEHHDSNNDNCHNKGNFGWSGCQQFSHGHFEPSDALHKCREAGYCVVRPKSGLRQSMLGLPVPQVLLRQVATSTSGITMRSPLPCPLPGHHRSRWREFPPC